MENELRQAKETHQQLSKALAAVVTERDRLIDAQRTLPKVHIILLMHNGDNVLQNLTGWHVLLFTMIVAFVCLIIGVFSTKGLFDANLRSF